MLQKEANAHNENKDAISEKESLAVGGPQINVDPKKKKKDSKNDEDTKDKKKKKEKKPENAEDQNNTLQVDIFCLKYLFYFFKVY